MKSKKIGYSPNSPLLFILNKLNYIIENKLKAKEHMKIAAEIWKDADPEYVIANNAKDKLKSY